MVHHYANSRCIVHINRVHSHPANGRTIKKKNKQKQKQNKTIQNKTIQKMIIKNTNK